jgi:hypothetical protein
MSTASSSAADLRLPEWLAEPLAVLSSRKRLVITVAAAIVFLGAIIAMLFPSVLPPRPLVGAAVGVAAALLATAVALALDASDLIVRGARHVTAAGGVVGVRTTRAHDDVAPLLAAVARHAHRPGPLKIALVPASRTAGVPGARAAALAESLAKTGRKVLFSDLTRSGTPAAGLSDVVAGTRQLSEVVRFESELYLARLAVGADPDAALKGMPAFVAGLPTDLEALVAALPPLAEPGALPAAEAFDLVFVLVEVDRTERVDLIASLDAMDTSRVASELVLIEPEAPEAAAPVIAPSEVTRDEPSIGDLDAPDDDPIVAEYTFEDDSPVEPVVAPIATGSVWDDDEDAVDDLADAAGIVPDADAVDAATDWSDEPDESDWSDESDDVEAADEPDQPAAADQPADADEPDEDWSFVDAPDADEPVTMDAEDDGTADAIADELAPAAAGEVAEVADDTAVWTPEPGTRTRCRPARPRDGARVIQRTDHGDAGRIGATSDATSAATSGGNSGGHGAAASDGAGVPWLPGSSLSTRPEAADDELVGADPAAMEAARTSAALYQLAQQVWDREDA